MSGYFARLAQRTGLEPGMAAPVRAAAPRADVIEHHVEVGAPVVAAAPDARAREAALFGKAPARTGFPAPAVAAPEGAAIEEERAGAEPSPGVAPAIETSSITESWPLARTSSAESQRSRMSAPRLPPAEAPAAPGEEKTALPGIATPARPIEPESGRAQAKRADEESMPPALVPAPAVVEAPAAPPRLTGERRGALSEPEPFKESATVKRAAWEGGPDPSRFKADLASPQARPRPAAQEASVHIGAIQVEIHPPVPPPSRPTPARQDGVRERPRFEPRRHYLRF